MTTYHQCLLRRDNVQTTAWIESRGAKPGASVELKPDNDLWEVVEVYQASMSEDVLRETQRQRRAKPPSLK